MRGLMLDGRRKSMRPMGTRLGVDDTGFKNDGAFSPCVARQHSGTLGKTGNCQIGVSIHAAADQASCPLDWRLYTPQQLPPTPAGTTP